MKGALLTLDLALTLTQANRSPGGPASGTGSRPSIRILAKSSMLRYSLSTCRTA